MKTLWNKKEVAILIYGYCLIKEEVYSRKYVVQEISHKLRNKYNDIQIDDKFRNENGISMKLGNIDYLFSEGKSGFKNYSKMEYELYDLYLNNKPEFNKILGDAKEEYNIEWDYVV